MVTEKQLQVTSQQTLIFPVTLWELPNDQGWVQNNWTHGQLSIELSNMTGRN